MCERKKDPRKHCSKTSARSSTTSLASAIQQSKLSKRSKRMNQRARNTKVSTATVARWRRIGLRLVGATLAYNVVEGILALMAGAHAGSIALVGFGLDSFIEYAAGA